MFQGGYVAYPLHLFVSSTTPSPYVWQKSITFYPENNNTLQSFSIPLSSEILAIKLVMERSSDSYGRVVMYSLGVLGTEA